MSKQIERTQPASFSKKEVGEVYRWEQPYARPTISFLSLAEHPLQEVKNGPIGSSGSKVCKL